MIKQAQQERFSLMDEDSPHVEVTATGRRIWPYRNEAEVLKAAKLYINPSTSPVYSRQIMERIQISENAVAAVPVLLSVFHMKDMDTRHNLLDLIDMLLEKGEDLSHCAKELSTHLADPNFALRQRVMGTMMKMGPAAAGGISRILRLIQHKIPDVRIGAIRLVGTIGPVVDHQARPVLERYLKVIENQDPATEKALRASLRALHRGMPMEMDQTAPLDVYPKPTGKKIVQDRDRYPRLIGKTVMLTDNDLTTRKLLEVRLEKIGCHFAVTDNGLDLVARMVQDADQGRLYDLLILDMMIHGMTVVEVLTCLRSHKGLQRLPVMVQGARTDPRMIRDLAKLGVKSFIVKPYKTDQILERLDTFFRQNQQGQRARG